MRGAQFYTCSLRSQVKLAQFHVPQFIEVESRIFGSLTFKQFAYIIGGAGFIFLLYALIPWLWLTILLGAPIGFLTLALAFLKIHGKPFIKVVENAVRYFSGGRLYLWKKPAAKQKQEKNAPKKTIAYIPKLTESRLQDLAWSLDVKEKIK